MNVQERSLRDNGICYEKDYKEHSRQEDSQVLA